MNLFSFRKASKAAQILAFAALATLGLNGCGGGGGGGSDKAQIAPATLEGVRLTLFNNAFTLKFFKTASLANGETGGADYDSIRREFRVAKVDGSGNLGTTYTIPVTLDNVKYTYIRTGPNTGNITLTWINGQAYPAFPKATKDREGPNGLGDLFWGGPLRRQTELQLGIIFAGDPGGTVTSSTVRVRSVYNYFSVFVKDVDDPDDDGTVISDANPDEFDSTNSAFSLALGGALPSGYNPEIDSEIPSGIVFTDVQGLTLDFDGTDLTRRIAHQSSNGTPTIPIPGEELSDIEDSGSVLVDEISTGGSDIEVFLPGQYSYIRTGGVGAKFAVRYTNSGGSVTVTYTMTFDSIDGGTFIDSNGASGTFLRDNFTNL